MKSKSSSKKCILLFAVLLTAMKILSQNKVNENITELPINPDTKQISISTVVNIPSTSISEIYSRVEDWFVFTQNQVKSYHPNLKRDKSNEARIVSITKYSNDINNFDTLIRNKQKQFFKVVLYNLKDIGIGEAKWQSGYEFFDLIVLIKENKYKIEATNFSHYVNELNSSMGITGSGNHVYYNDRVISYDEQKGKNEKLFWIRSKKWNEFRLYNLNKTARLINEIIDYINNPSKSSMDF
jgi:hypothetical protein